MPYSKYKQRSKKKNAAHRRITQRIDKETDVGVDLQETDEQLAARSTGAIPKIRSTNSQKKSHGRKPTANRGPSEAESFDMELRCAIEMDDTRAVYHILSEKAFYELQDSNGNTCLHLACEYGNDEIALMLIVAGADINKQNKAGRTPLHTALWHRQPEIADIILILRQKSLNLQDEDGNAPLHIGARRGYAKLMEIMIAAGADISLQNNIGCTPLHIVLGGKQLIRLPHILIKKPQDNQPPQQEGEESAAQSAAYGDTITVCFEFSKSDEPIKVTSFQCMYYQETTSYLESSFTFCRMGNVSKKLVNIGHANDLQDMEGDTPLHIALRAGHKEIVWWLLYNNARTQVKNVSGISPLQEALKYPPNGLARMILAMCALREIAVNWQDVDGRYVSVQLGIELWEACKSEVQRMKKTKVGQSSVAYYDFATEPVYQLAVYLQNDDIRKVLLDGDKVVKFPDYNELIAFKVKGAEERRVLSNQCMGCFSILPGKLPSLPVTSIDAILTFLNDQDMKNFVEAFECKTEKLGSPIVYKNFMP